MDLIVLALLVGAALWGWSKWLRPPGDPPENQSRIRPGPGNAAY